MIYLLLSIISSSLLMVIFKIAGRKELDTYNIIVINYITAATLGFLISGAPTAELLSVSWLPFAIIIGILLIVIFILMAYSTRTSGIAITTVAVKMSVIIPITFSIVYFREELTALKVIGIVLAMLSVYLTVYKKSYRSIVSKLMLFLPVLLFFGSGMIDTLIKFTQETLLEEKSTVMFSSVLFLIAGISGIIYSPLRKKPVSGYFKSNILIAGIILGIINFGSIYGIVMALESGVFDSSIIFGINNIGIVILSLVLALLLFGEKLTTKNKIGVVLSVITIVLLGLV